MVLTQFLSIGFWILLIPTTLFACLASSVETGRNVTRLTWTADQYNGTTVQWWHLLQNFASKQVYSAHILP